MQRFAFIIHRSVDFKFMGPAITEAARRGHDVECWLDERDIGGGSKDYQKPDPRMAPMLPAGAINKAFSSLAELSHLASLSTNSAIFSIYPALLKHIRDNAEARSRPRLVLVHENLDTLLLPKDPSDVGVADINALFSSFWVDLGRKYYDERGEDYKRAFETSFVPNAKIVGNIQLDAARQIDKQLARHRLGLPTDSPLILVLPLAVRRYEGPLPRIFLCPTRWKQFKELVKHGAGEHWRYPLMGWNEKALYQAIADFAQRNDARLIVKSRRKDIVPPGLLACADKVFFDESYYPSTMLDLLVASDLLIHFYSTAAMEAAFTGTPSLCVGWNNYDSRSEIAVMGKMWRHAATGHVFNAPGVNLWMSIGETIADLPKMTLPTFSASAVSCRDYVTRYLGHPDGNASKRLLDEVCHLLDQDAACHSQQGAKIHG